MNKKEFTAKVAAKTGLTSLAVSKVVDEVFNTLKEGLENGDTIALRGFGSFSTVVRSERSGINPSTMQPMVIKARKMVKFKASSGLLAK